MSHGQTSLPAIPTELAERGLAMRERQPDDQAFLADLYARNRWSELDSVPWNEEQKRRFLAQQFEFQDVHYTRHYTGCAFGILLLDGERIGRLYLYGTGDDLRIVDITLLAEYRGQGLGGLLLNMVFDQARRQGAKVSLHVDPANPARRLYERLGFVAAGENGTYLLMERPAAPQREEAKCSG